MSDPKPATTKPGLVASQSGEAAGPSGEVLQLTPDQMMRWADLVARGDAVFPPCLAHAQEDQLRHQVRRLRRARLVDYIARQIALDITRNAGPV
jgi:hypothetical protein